MNTQYTAGGVLTYIGAHGTVAERSKSLARPASQDIGRRLSVAKMDIYDCRWPVHG